MWIVSLEKMAMSQEPSQHMTKVPPKTLDKDTYSDMWWRQQEPHDYNQPASFRRTLYDQSDQRPPYLSWYCGPKQHITHDLRYPLWLPCKYSASCSSSTPIKSSQLTSSDLSKSGDQPDVKIITKPLYILAYEQAEILLETKVK